VQLLERRFTVSEGEKRDRTQLREAHRPNVLSKICFGADGAPKTLPGGVDTAVVPGQHAGEHPPVDLERRPAFGGA
jgi:hypothetical protein